MNFKPTLLKSIISIIAVVISDFFQVKSIDVDCVPYPGASCPPVLWKDFAFESRIVIISLIIGLIIYVIWSLFQKKKKN